MFLLPTALLMDFLPYLHSSQAVASTCPRNFFRSSARLVSDGSPSWRRRWQRPWYPSRPPVVLLRSDDVDGALNVLPVGWRSLDIFCFLGNNLHSFLAPLKLLNNNSVFNVQHICTEHQTSCSLVNPFTLEGPASDIETTHVRSSPPELFNDLLRVYDHDLEVLAAEVLRQNVLSNLIVLSVDDLTITGYCKWKRS